MPWYDEHPGRLEFELRELEELGFQYEIDAAKRAAGEIVLTVKYRIGEQEHPLRVVYPAHYPYFAFQVFAPTLDLAQHQDPYSKILCFVARIDSEWCPTDTIARFLRDRLPEVLRANEGDNSVVEAREGAPATGYMKFEAGSLVITADLELPVDAERGSLVIGYEPGTNPNALLRAVVLEVRDMQGNLLGQANPVLPGRVEGRLEGRWLRLPHRPRSTEPLHVLEEAISRWPELRALMLRGGPDVVGIVFQDDARFREKHDLWVFIVRRRDRAIAPRNGKRLPPGDQFTCYLARSDRGGREDLEIRVPRLKSLAGKKAAIFGLGALGSSLALQLAKAGIGRLHLVDHDYVQAGNIPRWAMGWAALGFPKSQALGAYIYKNYPFVQPISSELKVGAPLPIGAEAGMDVKLLNGALDGADVIIDCTVETTVHHFLSARAWSRGTPYVWMNATPGGWGGIIGRSQPGKTAGCWKCFKHYQTAGRYAVPAAEDIPDVQPIGCFSPTFTGTGFDMDFVALAGVRITIATLCQGATDGYPDFNWDIGILNLWQDGRPIGGDWATYALERHPDCDVHP